MAVALFFRFAIVTEKELNDVLINNVEDLDSNENFLEEAVEGVEQNFNEQGVLQGFNLLTLKGIEIH